MMYVQEIHRDNERFPNRQAVEAHMPFWAKEKGVGVCSFKRKEDNSQKDGKSKYLVNKCSPCHSETVDTEDFEQIGPAGFPLAYHTWPMFFLISCDSFLPVPGHLSKLF